MSFLNQSAKYITDNWKDLGEFCVICPNKRTIDYLKHYLSQILGRTIWSPKFFNLSEFTQQYTELEKTDDLVLLVELFKAFKKKMKESEFFNDYDFDKFISLGEIILKDFNEIDNYLVNVSEIFRNITDYEQINYMDDVLNDDQKIALKEFFGHFESDDLSAEKKYFLEIWSNIPNIYAEFTNNLKKKNIGYNGFVIRELVERMQNKPLEFKEYDTYIFVGFYALTKAQKYLLSSIKKAGKAKFLWDYDNYYVDNTENEAGFFIRQNLKTFSDDLNINRDQLLLPKNVSLVGFPLEIAQTKALPTILKKMGIDYKNKKQLAKTAIVLPDEKLLFPVLHSLPADIKQVNVTLGFPFRNSSVFSFIEKWFDLLNKLLINEKVFLQIISDFFSNQLVKEVFADSYDFIQNSLKNTNKLYFNINDFKKINNYFLNLLFDAKNLSSVEILLENILSALEIVFRKISTDERKVETEAIYQFYSNMLSVQSLFNRELQQDKNIISVKTMIKFLKQLLSSVHIPFTGKSLDGLQVMTIMETRNIDFENLIILNLNEQIIPKKATHQSLISEFMRKAYNLPLLKYQDSIFAYFFYRLLQRSKNVFLTYSNIISDKIGEMSRFVQQLKYETNIISQQYQYTEQIQPKRTENFFIEKNDDIYLKLKKYLIGKKTLSATALNNYITCPMKFYFSKIAEIEIPEDDDENYEIDALKFGNIFHKSMEELYKPFIGKEITADDIDNIYKKIEGIVKNIIYDELMGLKEATNIGINTIITQVVKKYIKNVLEYDKNNSPFKLISVEKSNKYFGKFEFDIDGKKNNVNIYSVLDRVDLKNNEYKIIDYKTGSDSLNINNITKLFDSNSQYNYKGFFQMIIYSLVYQQNFPNRIFKPYIFLISSMNKDFQGSLFFKKNCIDSYYNEFLSLFEENLKEVLSELFDKKIPFEQTKNIDNCKYCDYKDICGR